MYYGLNRGEHEGKTGLWYREWAPGARAIALVGEFNNWQPAETHWASKNEFGTFQLFLADAPDGTPVVTHRTKVCLHARAMAGGCVHQYHGATLPPPVGHYSLAMHETNSFKLAVIKYHTGLGRNAYAPECCRPQLPHCARHTNLHMPNHRAPPTQSLSSSCIQVKARVETATGEWVERIPAWMKWATQEWNEVQFNGVHWEPPQKGAPGEIDPDKTYTCVRVCVRRACMDVGPDA